MNQESEQWEKCPQCKCKINVLGGIAATEKANKILLSELHRWWGKKKYFWGKQRENLKNPQNPGETGTDWVDPLCFISSQGKRANEHLPYPQMYCSWSCFFFRKIQAAWGNLTSWVLFNKVWKEVSITIWPCRNLELSTKQHIRCSKISYTLLLPSFWTIVAHYCLTRWDSM